MTVLQITCDNCGAKYKLPETFTGAQAKCQKCGSVIDVAKQRAAGSAPAAAAAKPAAAKPAAAARPAIDRSKQAPKEAPAASKPERATRRGKDEGGGDEGGAGRRGRGERPAKKANNMPLILSGVGLVAIVVVVVLMMGGGGDKAKTDTTAKNEPSAPQPAAQQPAVAPTPEPAKPEPTPAPAPTPKEEPKPAATPTDASATPPAPAPAAPAVPDDPSRPKRPWEKLRNPPATMADVTDPKSYGEVKWPTGVDDAKKAEIRALAADAAGDGIRSVRAKASLEKAGFVGLFGIVEELQKLDYKSAEQSMVAFDLNKLIDQITAGLNARFEPVEASEEIVPAKAEWNTRTVKGWMDLLAGYADEAAYDKARAERVKKNADK